MALTVYFLCALTSAVCAAALLREYARNRTRLLLWSSLSFTAFALSNALVFTDFVLLPENDLSILRAATACAGIVLLLVGLIGASE